ncbi:helix-turn-helix transcriptional regulator [Propioniciclava sp.]|uniref:helix-turn-helix domain-containing protein n=1 Tax=Propioniciclava sp. TaxID=2038686 RepID=UPI002637A076|nr:helix-turn-helix transcriptional regulator [Propioniciclava sp.]
MREMLGETLRELRMSSAKTLREVSGEARVSLGYLSEVERGQKEASSELLNAICGALDVPLADVLRLVSDRVEAHATVTPLPLRTPQAAA